MKNLERLEELKKEIEEHYFTNETIEELLNIRDELENYNTTLENIVDIEILEEMAKNELNKYGLERLYYFLPSDINGNPYAYDNFFIIDGYGNAQTLEKNDLLIAIDELIEGVE